LRHLQVLHELWINEGYTSPAFMAAAQVPLRNTYSSDFCVCF